MSSTLLIQLLPILISAVTNGAAAVQSIIDHLHQSTELTPEQEQALKDAETALEQASWWQQQP